MHSDKLVSSPSFLPKSLDILTHFFDFLTLHDKQPMAYFWRLIISFSAQIFMIFRGFCFLNSSLKKRTSPQTYCQRLRNSASVVLNTFSTHSAGTTSFFRLQHNHHQCLTLSWNTSLLQWWRLMNLLGSAIRRMLGKYRLLFSSKCGHHTPLTSC